jgi:hypothetical protein
MNSLCRVLVLIAMVGLAAFLMATPIPKSMRQGSKEYMPLMKGCRWEYSTTNSPDVVTEVREIIATETKDGTLYATQQTSNLTQRFRKDSTGIALIESGGAKHANPRYIIQPKMKEGDTWSWDAGGYKENRRVGTPQKITVPAGEYTAMPVEFEYVQNGTAFRKGTVWYAAGVGLIRIDSDGEETQVLKKYTPGK